MARGTFDHVLGTNYVPTGHERQLLATLIKSKEQELLCLRDTIMFDKLNDDILAHKALLTPARGLPSELVSEVFTHSVNYLPPAQGQLGYNDGSLHRFAKPSVNEAPLVLGRICRHWRTIALSTPTLWSTISIPRYFRIIGLQTWISRAGSCDLSFGVFVEHASMEVLNFLGSYQQRWSDVVLGLVNHRNGDFECGRRFLESLSPGFPSLQILEVCARDSSYPPIPLVIGPSPNLRNLIFDISSIRITTLDDLPPLCLREVDVRCEWWTLSKELVTLLRLSPAVQVFRARVSKGLEPYEPHRDILNLPVLKQMDIVVHYEDDERFCVLERFHVPALEELSFRTSFDRIPHVYAPQIRSLIHQSHPPLKVLRVWGSHYLPSVDIMECLPFLPLLSTLHLEDLKGQIDGLINALTGPIPPSSDELTGCLCPELKEIYFDSTVAHHPNSDSVISMILSRRLSGRSRLADVTLLQCSQSEVLADPRIIVCIEKGLKFKGDVKL
ncbi:hypothetical protein BD410DRAFT_380354 [Rickenella mellea]|uniref:Uncharacterized protein n=1 Tax=Rickenella mellea TaxID=50990 RepID=A0A4Y7PZN1_9AGAM|nr:hypothetical protein BD410DRAFT_380354 [Rickenella mellea]